MVNRKIEMLSSLCHHRTAPWNTPKTSNSTLKPCPQNGRLPNEARLLSVVVNIGLTVGQVVAGVPAGSQALIADAIHSLSDLIADFLILFASHHSQKEAD